ncbi:MAG: hypothetical protein WAU27_02170, partial [Pseudomonadales bacterium]
ARPEQQAEAEQRGDIQLAQACSGESIHARAPSGKKGLFRRRRGGAAIVPAGVRGVEPQPRLGRERS